MFIANNECILNCAPVIVCRRKHCVSTVPRYWAETQALRLYMGYWVEMEKLKIFDGTYAACDWKLFSAFVGVPYPPSFTAAVAGLIF